MAAAAEIWAEIKKVAAAAVAGAPLHMAYITQMICRIP